MSEERKKEPRTPRSPKIWEACLVLILVCVVVVLSLQFGIESQMALFLGACVAILAALYFGVSWENIQKSFMKMMSDSLIPVVILMVVGIMVGAWIIGGTVPSLMYYGLKLCSPSIILPLTFVLCAVMAVFTGTSFGSIATMGLA